MGKESNKNEIPNETNVDTASAETEVTESVQTEYESALKLVEEYKDIAQRLQAEFDNYRKRNAESVANARNDGIDDVVTMLFPVLDNFERGMSLVSEEAKSGMELIYKQILAVLEKLDVKAIEALGEEFDPRYHHAIAQCEDSDNSNKVIEVYQKGYLRKNKVLRPSMVKVAQ